MYKDCIIELVSQELDDSKKDFAGAEDILRIVG